MIPAPAVRHPVPVSGGAGFPLRHGDHAGLANDKREGCDVRGGRGRRIGSVMTLTAVLRVWDLACFAEHAGRVTGAVVQAVVDRDSSVSGEGRRLNWAAWSCAASAGAEVDTFDKHSSEGKALMRGRGPIEAEWGEDGRLTWLARTSMLAEESSGEAAKKTESLRPLSPLAIPCSHWQRGVFSHLV